MYIHTSLHGCFTFAARIHARQMTMFFLMPLYEEHFCKDHPATRRSAWPRLRGANFCRKRDRVLFEILRSATRKIRMLVVAIDRLLVLLYVLSSIHDSSRQDECYRNSQKKHWSKSSFVEFKPSRSLSLTTIETFVHGTPSPST